MSLFSFCCPHSSVSVTKRRKAHLKRLDRRWTLGGIVNRQQSRGEHTCNHACLHRLITCKHSRVWPICMVHCVFVLLYTVISLKMHSKTLFRNLNSLSGSNFWIWLPKHAGWPVLYASHYKIFISLCMLYVSACVYMCMNAKSFSF